MPFPGRLQAHRQRLLARTLIRRYAPPSPDWGKASAAVGKRCVKCLKNSAHRCTVRQRRAQVTYGNMEPSVPYALEVEFFLVANRNSASIAMAKTMPMG